MIEVKTRDRESFQLAAEPALCLSHTKRRRFYFSIPLSEEVYDFMQYNGLFMQQYGKCLAMEEKFEKSIDILQKSGQYYRDEFWYIVLADSYKAVGDTENAEIYYKQASFVVPHKFYPLYLLAKLYNETGQTEKAKIQANFILKKEVKVESTAIKEIKAEMEEILKD